MMTSKEIAIRTIERKNPERFAYDFPERYGTDFYWAEFEPSPDPRPLTGVDEYGTEWQWNGVSKVGLVVDFPLKDWSDYHKIQFPTVNLEERVKSIAHIREEAKDKYIICRGVSIFERYHFLRGFDNAMTDVYDNPEKVKVLLRKLTDMNLEEIPIYKQAGGDGFMLYDDWGLQTNLMISPNIWREIWKPFYAEIFEEAHAAGMHTFLHSCGYIVDILDDLIEIGLDVIHMDQQENMGIDYLDERFGGKITFFAPVDIQKTMIYGTMDDIKAYCRNMVKHLSKPEGGFIPRWYFDSKGAGHSDEAVNTMCSEFLKIKDELYGKNV